MNPVPSDQFIMEEETRRGEALISSPAQPTRSTHSPSHHASAPARRNRRRAWLRQRQPLRTSHLLLVVFLTCCLSLTAASSSVYIAESMVEVEESPMSETFQESLARLARTGTILVDPRPPPNVEPNPHAWTLATLDDDLAAAQRRSLDRPNQNSHDRLNARQVGDEHADADAKSSSSSMISTATRPSPTKSSETASGTSGIVAQTSTASSTLPTPFDTGFGGNITQSCSDFMSGFLGNATFKECLPFSLLLQVRFSSFFLDTPESRLGQRQQLSINQCINLQTTILIDPSIKYNPTPLSHLLQLPQLTNPTGLNFLLRSLQIHHPHDPNPRQDLRCQRLAMRPPHDRPRREPHIGHQLRIRLHEPEPAHPASAHGPARLHAALHRVVPAQPGHAGVLLRRRRHQRLLPDRLVRLLPPAQHQPARRQPAHVRRLPAEHHAGLRERQRRPPQRPRQRLCRGRAADQRPVRAGLRRADAGAGGVGRGAGVAGGAAGRVGGRGCVGGGAFGVVVVGSGGGGYIISCTY
jgi:hypothetical protein